MAQVSAVAETQAPALTSQTFRFCHRCGRVLFFNLLPRFDLRNLDRRLPWTAQQHGEHAFGILLGALRILSDLHYRRISVFDVSWHSAQDNRSTHASIVGF